MADQIVNLTKNHTSYCNYKHEATVSFKMKHVYFALSMLIKATVDHTISDGSLRLRSTRWTVSVYWKIVRSLQQILPSLALFAKQFEDLERRIHHHTQATNKT